MGTLRGFQVGLQQVEHMPRAAQQGMVGVAGFQRMARVAHVFVAEPVGQYHHHAGGGGGQGRTGLGPGEQRLCLLHAFEHGEQGDLFVQKAPASTVGDLAQALKELFGRDNQVRVIGTRHGEKLYESLVSREEMAKAEDMGRYYRIPADNRDLNYKKYFVEGEEKISEQDDYTSHNTVRLDVPGIKLLLLKLDYIKEQLDA